MRKLIMAAVAATTIAVLAVPALASADVARYQVQKGTLTTKLTEQGYVHTYNITVNPCDNTFTGTGTGAYPDGTPFSKETVAGTIKNGQATFTATYQSGGIYPGYQWGVSTPGTMWDSWGESLPVTTTLNLTSSNYKNHGDYVSSVGGGADAAHSCIGMPINSSN